jgi:adenylylsulfate kinase
MVIWLIGLSGSGKTTLGREVARQWRALEPNTVLLDGDEVREVFADDRGTDPYTLEGRRRNAERMTALCALLDRQGINVVCCILSIFPEMRALNRERFGRYFEIFMNAPLEVLERRDVKGLYAAAREGRVGNVVGMQIPFPAPADADLVIDTSGATPDIAALAAQVLALARSK